MNLSVLLRREKSNQKLKTKKEQEVEQSYDLRLKYADKMKKMVSRKNDIRYIYLHCNALIIVQYNM